ncbi:polysaccharide deacetylase family protein [Yinghuangia seranimata]|uniref:polysaccharide deacetylase family protein n=1 Tax=Yinghuangia seranimata TaxID=408067 RepID=UPI00248D1978|nr:polysaccharide deacetylase family protein [Yinghuangia seranimata]MDI2130214.1 polysaccharide deacetylase family protein [Yinghuangia seranimata]
MRSSLRAGLRDGGDVLMRRSPAQWWFGGRASGRLAVLGYHGVDDPEGFARQVDRLLRIARPVSLDEVEHAVALRRPLPGRAVLVTFDDGERSVYEHGLPVLRERGVPAVAFVIPSLVDTETPYWWHEVDRLVAAGAGPERGTAQWLRHLKTVPQAERLATLDTLRAGHPPVRQRQLTAAEVRELDSGGVRVENHSLTHPLLDRCGDDDIRTEIVAAHERLTEILGHAPRSFAYPNGNWDARAERVLDDLGYGTAFLFDHRLGPRLPDHPLRISRLRIATTTSPDRFETILSGLHPAVHGLRGRG